MANTTNKHLGGFIPKDKFPIVPNIEQTVDKADIDIGALYSELSKLPEPTFDNVINIVTGEQYKLINGEYKLVK